MLAAYGWVVARSSRGAYRGATPEGIDEIDEATEHGDTKLFSELQERLKELAPPVLNWSFRAQMNNVRGILMMSSSTNHRGSKPIVLEVLRWLAEHRPDSYGLVYLHDDEDSRGEAFAGSFRVWRLLRGQVDELEDPFLSPLVPTLDATGLE